VAAASLFFYTLQGVLILLAVVRESEQPTGNAVLLRWYDWLAYQPRLSVWGRRFRDRA
jgi:hypothetical protein